MIDNMEIQSLLAHKIAFQCSIVRKSNEISDSYSSGSLSTLGILSNFTGQSMNEWISESILE